MVPVSRSNVPRPKWFGSKEWGTAQHAMLKHVGGHFFAKGSARSQKRAMDVIGPFPKEVVEAVRRLFDGRCAICESNVRESGPDAVKHFRPVEVEGSKDRFAHGYAALLWENLILLCPACDRSRGDRFALAGSSGQTNERLREINFDLSKSFASSQAYHLLEGVYAEARKSERSWQLDPTFDQPGHCLEFDEKGRVPPTGRRTEEGWKRGQHTIEVFQLNRSELIKNRGAAGQLVGKALHSIPIPSATTDSRAAAALVNRLLPQLFRVLDLLGGEYQAAKSFRLMRWMLRWMRAPLPEVLRHVDLPVAQRQHAERVLVPIWETLNAKGSRATSAQSPARAPAGRTEAAIPTPPSFSRERVVKVRLRNFRHFRTATFSLPLLRPEDAFGADHELRTTIRAAGIKRGERLSEPTAYCGWKMLLGENGVGKSSVLQAIALALLADEKGDAALVDAEYRLRENLPHGARNGSIEVWMENAKTPIRLGFSAKAVTLKRAVSDSPPEPKPTLFVRGYGAARLLPPRENSDGDTFAPQQVGNLFDPHHALADPEKWLMALPNDPQRLAFITLKDLLDLPADDDLKFKVWQGRKTFGLVRKHGPFTPLAHFSAGYQSVVALGCDIMAGFGRAAGDVQKRTGLVLLDEIGTNLHPRWRLRIVQSLRRAFPQMQFIVSTHEPLCLRGLGEDEVALLTLDKKHQVQLRDDLPSPAIYRVDQLLTGDFFGLETAYDPDEEAAFDAYHALLVEERKRQSQGKALLREHAGLLDRLRDRLKDRLTLGDTIAERKVMAALEEAELQPKVIGKREFKKADPRAKAAAKKLLQQLSPDGKKATP